MKNTYETGHYLWPGEGVGCRRILVVPMRHFSKSLHYTQFPLLSHKNHLIPSPPPPAGKMTLRPSRRSTTTGYERHMQICSSVVFRGNQGTKPIFPVSHGAGVSLMSSCEKAFRFQCYQITSVDETLSTQSQACA